MSWSRRPGRIRAEAERDGGREDRREGGREEGREGVPALVVGHGDVDELVQTPGAHQGRVDNVGPVGSTWGDKVGGREGGREGGRDGGVRRVGRIRAGSMMSGRLVAPGEGGREGGREGTYR